MVEPLSEDQADALQEVTNVAMGRAARSLSTLLDTFVTLAVPRVQVVDAANAAEAVQETAHLPGTVTAVRQAFFHGLRGEALTLFAPGGGHNVADLLGLDADDADQPPEDEILIETSNILVGAILSGLGEQLDTQFSYTPPSVFAKNTPMDRVLDPGDLEWTTALLVEVTFTLESRNFVCHVLVLLAEDSIAVIRQALDRLLEDL
ncbi:CheC, inhibitor of MCP methylation [Limimonas halophila]|uniref:CheC, inhibitor of MCP methylation n=1 Tax=Limimonas halophila TaxID=1082479 RepID=A0A1G7KVL1_9PROT|nr:chemotaxis protein CheC [Limimonas halophila]SDF41263.1 CheC, inhibitor of MCP methylation [Limimonas halophila]